MQNQNIWFIDLEQMGTDILFLDKLKIWFASSSIHWTQIAYRLASSYHNSTWDQYTVYLSV